MKKITTLALAALFVLVLAGCSKSQEETQSGNQQQAPKQEMQKEEKGVFASIKDAMSSGKKMKCTYTVTQGENVMQSEAFVEGDKYKAVTTFNDQSTYMIFDGEDTYTWTDQTKQGMKMSKECMEDMEEDVEEMAQDMEETEEYHGEDPFENAASVKCEKAGSADFSLPSGVEFVDQCEVMKTQQKQMEQMMDSMPEGFEMPAMQ